MPCRSPQSTSLKSVRFVALAFLAVLVCAASLSTARAAGQGSPLHRIAVDNDRGKMEWTVELASDPSSRSRGLMFRKTMPADQGMLFRFETVRPVTMWMANTFISLDMIFIAESGEIAHIHRNAVPQSRDIISSRIPVRYVLELNAGSVERAGLAIGQIMRHPWFSIGQ